MSLGLTERKLINDSLKVVQEYEKGKERHTFFNAVFTYIEGTVISDEGFDEEYIGIPKAIKEKHPELVIKNGDLIFFIRSNCFDEHDVVTTKALFVDDQNFKISPSGYLLSSTERNEKNTQGKIKLYIPKITPLVPSVNEVAKFLFDEGWFYGQTNVHFYHGIGMYYTPRETYIGSFKSNQKHGKGVSVKINEQNISIVYYGDYNGNFRHGNGILRDSGGFYWKVEYEKNICTKREMIEQDVKFESVVDYDDDENPYPVINISAVE